MAHGLAAWRRGAWGVAVWAALLAAGCDQPYGAAPAPVLRLTNVNAITDSILRGIVLPGDGIAVVEVRNPGPAVRLREFRFTLTLGETEYGAGRFRGDVLLNPGERRTFNVPIASEYIPAVRMALDGAKPLRITYYGVAFLDANDRRRVEHWPAPPMAIR